MTNINNRSDAVMTPCETIAEMKEKAAAQQAKIAFCVEHESYLNDWERKFIDSISLQSAAGRGLTEKQLAKLEAIAEDIKERLEESQS